MRWLLLVFVASCYAPASYSNCGVTCAADIDCPTGQSCFGNRCSVRAGQCSNSDDAAAVDAAIDGSPNVDSDGDGLADSIDKCPMKSSQDNRDHDGDGLGDICDPCPMFTNNTNSDSDAIGDMCDPRPMNGADVAMFYGFYTDDEYSTWGRNGTWTIVDGKAVGSNVSLGGAYFETPVNFGGNVAVYAALAVTAVSTQTTVERMVGVSGRRNASGHYEGCQAAANPTLGKQVRVRRYNGVIGDDATPYVGMIDGVHPIRFVAIGGTDDCLIDTTSVQSSIGAVAIGKAAIDSSFVDVAVDYLFVVTMN